METIEGYGYFHNNCIYESAYVLMSFHRTKAGAYRAMRADLMRRWEDGEKNRLRIPKKWGIRKWSNTSLTHHGFKVEQYTLEIND